jgi:hypothetical protein
MKKSKIFSCAISFFVYLNTLQSNFVYDDAWVLLFILNEEKLDISTTVDFFNVVRKAI